MIRSDLNQVLLNPFEDSDKIEIDWYYKDVMAIRQVKVCNRWVCQVSGLGESRYPVSSGFHSLDATL